MQQIRFYGSTAKFNENKCEHECDCDCDCDCVEEEQEIRHSGNEIVKITDACTVERLCENLPPFSDYDVLVRVGAVAISGSDIHVFETGGTSCPGMTIGHDAAGVIEKVGKCIVGLKPGDRVAVEAGLSCGICDICKRGLYSMCSQLIYNGFFSKYQVHPADLCHKLPDCITLEEGSLTHTLALGCQACQQAQITPTTNVLIMGSCPTAVSAALCSSALGACKVCLACSNINNLENVQRLYGFDFVLYDPLSDDLNSALQSIQCSFNKWPDVVINCAINEITMNLAIMSLEPCGTLVLTECDAECATFNALDVLMKNLKLVPSFRCAHMFPVALRLMETGRAPMFRLIARTYQWHNVAMAFRSAQHEANVGNKKVIVMCGDDSIHSMKEDKT